MKIDSVQIKNYRSIWNSGQVNLTKLFSLIGKNNCGKSALVEAIQVFWGYGGKKIEKSDFHKGTSEEVEIRMEFSDFNTPESLDKFRDKEGKAAIICRCSKPTLKHEYAVADGGKSISQAELKRTLPRLLVIPAIRNPENETTAGTRSFLKELIAALLGEGTAPAQDVEVLKAKKGAELDVEELDVLIRVKTGERIQRIEEKATGFFREDTSDSDKSIGIEPKSDLEKALSYDTKLKDPHLGPDLSGGVNILACGTGFQSMAILSLLQTYADLRKCDDSIMLIEEPEVYLHPELQRRMFSALRKIARKTQVIYTTHSPIMISDLWADKSVRLVVRDSGVTTFNQVDLQGVISELGIKYEDVLNPRVVVFVEGETDEAFFRELAVNLYPGLLMVLDRVVKFIPTDNFRTIQTFALMKILHSDSVSSDFFLIADSDGRDPDERKKGICANISSRKIPLSKKGINLLDRIIIPNGHELEWYFLDSPLILKVVPSLSEEHLDAFLKLYKEGYEKVRSLYLKAKGKRDKEEENLAQCRPSLLFTPFKGEKRRRSFQALLGLDDASMDLRDKIVGGWRARKESGEDPAKLMLDGLDVRKSSSLIELVGVVDHILSNSGVSSILAEGDKMASVPQEASS